MEPDWSGPQTRLGCGCKLYMVLVNDGLEAPEIDFCEIHASALGLAKKLEAAERERWQALVQTLVEALEHMQLCGPCAEGSWDDCDGGRAAEAALAAAREQMEKP